MDPFDVRIRFTSMLQSLNASVTSANKAAQYALKYRDMDEDLHSCILEQLERNSINTRANTLYFIDVLCDMAAREGHADYVRMMQRDILRIVDAVAPEDGSGAANVKVVRKVLQGLRAKGFLLAQTVGEIEEVLQGRDRVAAVEADEEADEERLRDGDEREDDDAVMAGARATTAPGSTAAARPSSSSAAPGERAGRPNDRDRDHRDRDPLGAATKLDRKTIEQRIEEDRERHKRLRESIWAVPVNGGRGDDDAEFAALWEHTSDVGEDDWILYADEAEERAAAAREWKAQCLGVSRPVEV